MISVPPSRGTTRTRSTWISVPLPSLDVTIHNLSRNSSVLITVRGAVSREEFVASRSRWDAIDAVWLTVEGSSAGDVPMWLAFGNHRITKLVISNEVSFEEVHRIALLHPLLSVVSQPTQTTECEYPLCLPTLRPVIWLTDVQVATPRECAWGGPPVWCMPTGGASRHADACFKPWWCPKEVEWLGSVPLCTPANTQYLARYARMCVARAMCARLGDLVHWATEEGAIDHAAVIRREFRSPITHASAPMLSPAALAQAEYWRRRIVVAWYFAGTRLPRDTPWRPPFAFPDEAAWPHVEAALRAYADTGRPPETMQAWDGPGRCTVHTPIALGPSMDIEASKLGSASGLARNLFESATPDADNHWTICIPVVLPRASLAVLWWAEWGLAVDPSGDHPVAAVCGAIAAAHFLRMPNAEHRLIDRLFSLALERAR